MVFHTCINNFKGVVIARPPLVVFTLCLIALAVATLSLARMVSDSDKVPNPDIKIDWNVLLKRMTNLEFCVEPDNTYVSDTTLIGNSTEQKTVTASIFIDKKVHNIHNNTRIYGSIPSQLLLMKDGELIHVSFHIDGNAGNAHVPITVCATFTGPVDLLPETTTPPSCTAQSSNKPAFASAKLMARPKGPEMSSNWCNEDGTILRLEYDNNPNLTAMLTLHDRSVINLHLMHTSYFLIVMAMTLVCYALLKGKPTAKQLSTIEKVPLEH